MEVGAKFLNIQDNGISFSSRQGFSTRWHSNNKRVHLVRRVRASSSSSSSSSSVRESDVVVVGAGIIGLTIARQILLTTRLSVSIVDAKKPCAGATGAGQGYIWMGYRTPESDKWELEARSKLLWEELVQEIESTGNDSLKALGWKTTGSLLVGTTVDESSALEERVANLTKAGVRADFLSGSSLHKLEPALEVGEDGAAAFIPDDSQIDAKLAASYIQKNNCIFTPQGRYNEFFDNPVLQFLRSGSSGEIEGVRTPNYLLYGKKAVVVAAGAWSCSLIKCLSEELGFPLNVPVEPRKGHLLVLRRPSTLQLNHGLMELGYCSHQVVSSLPQSSSIETDESSQGALSISMTATTDSFGNLVLGSSRQFRGFDCEMENHVVEGIIGRASKFIPVLKDSSVAELLNAGNIRTGLRPYMPDGKPVISPVRNLPNLFLATGHEGAGLCMAFGTAEMVVDMIMGNKTKVDPTPFSAEGRCYN